MANIFQLKKNNILINPDVYIVKSHEFTTFLQANELLEQAKIYAAEIKKEAADAFIAEKERGFEEGLEEGRMEMAERTFEAIAKGIDFIESLEKTTVDIVMKSLQRILDDMPAQERIVNVVRRALAYVRGQKNVLMRVNPQELAWVEKEINDLSSKVLGVDNIRIVADKMLSQGACVLESDLGIIDASIHVQLNALRKVFESHLQKV